MNRNDLEQLIQTEYESSSDHPWPTYPNYKVFRHVENNKWFAIIMDIPRNKVGLEGDEIIDIVNFKCDPNLIGSLILEEGFFSAYHMNKKYWVSVALDGSADEGKIKMLLDMSYGLTHKLNEQETPHPVRLEKLTDELKDIRYNGLRD